MHCKKDCCFVESHSAVFMFSVKRIYIHPNTQIKMISSVRQLTFVMVWNVDYSSTTQFEFGVQAPTSSLLANLFYMQELRGDDINLEPQVGACRWLLGWWRDWTLPRSTGEGLQRRQSRGRCRKSCSLNGLPNWENAWDDVWRMTNMNQCSWSCLPERRRRSIIDKVSSNGLFSASMVG